MPKAPGAAPRSRISVGDDRPELSDLIVSYDPETLARVPVRRSLVLDELERHGMAAGARIVATWPVSAEGTLDETFVDGVLLRAHLELLRLSEELGQGERTGRLLRPLLAALRASGIPAPYRVVDVGCGLGYLVRWLAAHGALGPDVLLEGCDYNAVLIDHARALAAEEGLACRLHVANAFRLDQPATVFVSTGVIHHFRGLALSTFLSEQVGAGARALIHADIKPSYLAPIGSWLFHHARMREPLARHDGILSARRAHRGDVLVRAARDACPNLAIGLFDGQRNRVPILRVMQSLLGLERHLAEPFLEGLGPLAARFEVSV